MPRPHSNPPAKKPSARQPQPPSQTEDVNPRWLLKALGITLIVALVCGYLTLCLLFYQGQWQLVLHPIHIENPPQDRAFIRFAPDESATPQLTGRWLPAPAEARYASTTILFLPSGDGSLADSAPTLDLLHNLGLNVFAFDYRGYGYSANLHPNQLRMTQDADSAWQYLTVSRAIPATSIIPFGTGVGASLATHLATTHPEIPALILQNPHADLLETVRRDPRTSALPVRLLFHDRFPLSLELSLVKTPKLLITQNTTKSTQFPTAAPPKLTVELLSDDPKIYTETLTRFLDQYLPKPVSTMAPSGTIPR